MIFSLFPMEIFLADLACLRENGLDRFRDMGESQHESYSW